MGTYRHFALIGLLAPTIAFGQVQPGSKSIQKLKAYTDTIDAVSIMNGQRRSGAVMVESLTLVREGRVSGYLFASDFRGEGDGASSLSKVFMQADPILPVWSTTRAAADSSSVAFHNDDVIGWTANASGVKLLHRRGIRAFPGGVTHQLLSALPLKAGYEVRFPVYDEWTDQQREVHFKVIGLDTVQFRGAAVVTYKVQEDPQSPRFQRYRWYDARSRRFIQSLDRLAAAPAGDGYWKKVR